MTPKSELSELERVIALEIEDACEFIECPVSRLAEIKKHVDAADHAEHRARTFQMIDAVEDLILRPLCLQFPSVMPEFLDHLVRPCPIASPDAPSANEGGEGGAEHPVSGNPSAPEPPDDVR